MSGDHNQKHLAIVGGGLVGALNACFMAKRGFKVDLFEKREDIRNTEIAKGRSINLSLSMRGNEALRIVGLESLVTEQGIPMYGRMIHKLDQSQHPLLYGKKDQFILSVDRRKLNEILLTAAEKYPNVTFHFEHKLITSDFQTGEMEFEKKEGRRVKFNVDLIIGNDGAFSAVRRQMMQTSLLNYQQEYIPHGYMELTIPPRKTQMGEMDFAMPANYLHIWPRNEFMMIGLPNQDKSFTLTLFMPFEIFDSIKTEEEVMKFFEETFPDSVLLIGESELKATFMKNKALPMVSIKCSPYNVGGKVVIMGDAAHAMVPFYGQGMNAGFEDCIILGELLDKHKNNFDNALKEFTDLRKSDAHAINDLTFYNYKEMRKLVNTKLFLLRKRIDNFLYFLFPSKWVPLYTMVAFTRTRYHLCKAKKEWQDELLTRSLYLAGTAVVVGSVFGVKSLLSRSAASSLHEVMAIVKDSVSGLFNR